jgi:hypothetical protein
LLQQEPFEQIARGRLFEPTALPQSTLLVRGLAAVVAILGEADFQVLHTCQHRKALLAQALILGFELGNPLVGRHVSMLHPLCKSD